MTVSAAITETTYLLAGAALGPFSTVWPYEQDSDVSVYVDEGSGPTLMGAGQFSLVDAATGSLVGGGNVTLSASLLVAGAWPANSKLVLVRGVTNDQPSAFSQMTGFSPAASEKALDHVSRRVQDLASTLMRAVSAPPGDTTDMVLPNAETRASLFAAYDAAGEPIAAVGPLVGVPATVYAAALLGAMTALDALGTLGLGHGATPGAAELNLAATDNGQSINDLLTAIGFGQNGYAIQRMSRSYAPLHADSRVGHVTSSIVTGSGGDGPGEADFAGLDFSIKLNFLTSTIDGEVDGRWSLVRQGQLGDCSGDLIDVQKRLVGASLTGGALGTEWQVAAIDGSLNRVAALHAVVGFFENGNTSFGEGLLLEARTHAGIGRAILIDDFDDRSAGEITAGIAAGSFASALKVRRARNDANTSLIVGADANGSYQMGAPGNRKTLQVVSNQMNVLASDGATVLMSLTDGGGLTSGGILVSGTALILPAYTVSTVPSASAFARGQIYVSNESGGPTPAFSDGTNWRRYADRAIIS